MVYKEKKMRIEYDGGFPNLCRGNLFVIIDDKCWEFPSCCLTSGGGIYVDDKWDDHIRRGKWLINEWPEDFPENLKEEVLREVNSEIPWGCCGGCV